MSRPRPSLSRFQREKGTVGLIAARIPISTNSSTGGPLSAGSRSEPRRLSYVAGTANAYRVSQTLWFDCRAPDSHAAKQSASHATARDAPSRTGGNFFY